MGGCSTGTAGDKCSAGCQRAVEGGPCRSNSPCICCRGQQPQKVHSSCCNGLLLHGRAVLLVGVLLLAGAIKDSVVGEEAIVRFMLQFLGRDPQHSLRAIKASGPLGGKGIGSSRKGPSSTQHSKTDREVDRMRTCLHRVLSSSQQQPLLHAPTAELGVELQPEAWGAGGAGPFVSGSMHAFGDTNLPPWVVGDDMQHADDVVDLDVHRYEQLIGCLGVASVRNPSKETGALIRMLRAFREGHLGKFLLDADDIVVGGQQQRHT